MGIFWVGIVRVAVILDGNCRGGSYSGWELSSGNHPGGNFSSGSFHVTVFNSVIQHISKSNIHARRYCIA